MADPQDTLRAQIEAFLARTGMTPTAFGLQAVNDPRFVFDLQDGRECRRSTREKVAAFIAAHGAANAPRRRAKRAA